MTIKKICVFFFILLSISCSNEKLNAFQTIKITSNEAVILDLKEVFDELEYIYLSTKGNQGLIKEINEILFDGSDFYVFQDETDAPSICKFNKSGQLVFEEVSKEEGPGKFLGANDIALNNEDETIEILDSYQSKIVFCSKKDCSFIREIKTSFNFRQFTKIGSNDYAYYSANQPTNVGAFNLYVGKLNEPILSPFAPINPHLIGTVIENKCFSSFPFNGSRLFKQDYSNVIWRTSPSNTNEAYKVDFGSHWFNESTLQGLAGSDTEGKMKILNVGDDKVKSLKNIEEFQDNIFFDYYLSGRIYWNFYNKNTKSLKSFYIDLSSYKNPNNFEGGPIPLVLRGRYNEFMIFETTSELVHTLGKNAPPPSKFKQFAQTVPEEGNPVIILAKLKKKYQ